MKIETSFSPTKLLESEGSESSEGIIDNTLTNKQNDDDAIIVV